MNSNGAVNHIITTAEGIEVRLKPVAQYLITGAETSIRKEFAKAKKSLDIPEYEVKTVAGSTEKHPLDADSLEDPADPKQTEANKIAWANYQTNLDDYNLEYNARLTKLCLYFGVEYDKEDYKSGSWAGEQSFFGIEIPDKEPDRTLHYISTVILKTPSDVFETVMRVVNISMDGAVGEEKIDSAMATFRDQIRLAGKETMGSGEATNTEGEMVAQPEVSGDASS